MKTVRQILAIARNEFRFAFRRGAPVVTTALIGLLVGAGIVVLILETVPDFSSAVTMAPDAQARWLALGFTLQERGPFIRNALSDLAVFGSILAWLLMFSSLLLLPAATISAVPADRKFGVSELLRSTPLTGARYLAGKVLGMLLAVLLVGVVMLALFLAMANSIIFANLHFGLSGSADLYYIKLSLLDGILFLGWGTAIGVLLGVLFRTRRAAVFPGLIAGLLSIVFWSSAFRSPPTDAGLPMADRLEYYLLQNYHSTIQELAKSLGQPMTFFSFPTHVGAGQIVLMYGTILAALAVLAILARLWLQWKENF